MHGQGVKKDMKLAVKYMKEAAERGSPEAQFSLGTLYYSKSNSAHARFFFIKNESKLLSWKWCRQILRHCSALLYRGRSSGSHNLSLQFSPDATNGAWHR